MDKTCQIGNKILGAGEMLCSRLVQNINNLEILVPALGDVVYSALSEQVSMI